jgi:hypothetical protein
MARRPETTHERERRKEVRGLPIPLNSRNELEGVFSPPCYDASEQLSVPVGVVQAIVRKNKKQSLSSDRMQGRDSKHNSSTDLQALQHKVRVVLVVCCDVMRARVNVRTAIVCGFSLSDLTHSLRGRGRARGRFAATHLARARHHPGGAGDAGEAGP